MDQPIRSHFGSRPRPTLPRNYAFVRNDGARRAGYDHPDRGDGGKSVDENLFDPDVLTSREWESWQPVNAGCLNREMDTMYRVCGNMTLGTISPPPNMKQVEDAGDASRARNRNMPVRDRGRPPLWSVGGRMTGPDIPQLGPLLLRRRQHRSHRPHLHNVNHVHTPRRLQLSTTSTTLLFD